MDKDNLLAIGKEDQNGALIIDDASRNAQAEQAIDLMACGMTLVEAAKELGISGDKLRVLIGRNTEYDQKYARIKICRYIDMMERLIDFVDSLPDEVEHSREFKLTKQFDAYKFAIGKYDVHIAKAMADSGLTIDTGNAGSRITINIAQPISKDNDLRNVTDIIDTETESQ